MGNTLRRRSKPPPSTTSAPPPTTATVHTPGEVAGATPLVTLKEGHKLKYLYNDRELYVFRLCNFVEDGQYVGDCTREFDNRMYRAKNDDPFYALRFGVKAADPSVLVFNSVTLEHRLLSMPDSRRLQFREAFRGEEIPFSSTVIAAGGEDTGDPGDPCDPAHTDTNPAANYGMEEGAVC